MLKNILTNLFYLCAVSFKLICKESLRFFFVIAESIFNESLCKAIAFKESPIAGVLLRPQIF